MKTLSVGEFKAQFSQSLQMVKQGKTVGVAYGRKGELVAVLAPPSLLTLSTGVKLGLLQGKAAFQAKAGFTMSEEEILSS